MSRQVIYKRRWQSHLLLLSFFIYLLIHLLFIKAYPAFDRGGDESWLMDYSITFLKTGELKGSIFSLTPLNEPGLLNAYIYNGLLSLVFAITGPGIIWGRLFSLLSGIVVLYLVYLIGKELKNPLAGCLGALFLSLNVYFGASATELRPEALFTAFLCTSILFFIMALNRKRPIYLFLSSLFSASLIWVHPNALVACLALVLLYIFYYRRFFSKETLYLFSGFLLVSGIFLITNYLPLKDRALSTFSTVHLNYLPPLLRGDLKKYFNILLRAIPGDIYSHFFGGPSRTYMNYIPLWIFFVSGLAVLVFCLFLSKDKEAKGSIRLLFSFCLFLYLSSVLLSLQICQQVYLMYFMPFISLSISISLLEIKKALPQEKRILKAYLVESIIFIFAIVSLLDYGLTGLKFMRYKEEYNRAIKEISSIIPEGSSVLGGNMYYPAFLKKGVRFHSYLFMQNSCPDFRQALRTLHAGYVIWDNIFDYLASFWCYEPYRDKIRAFLEENGEVVRRVQFRYPFALSGEPEEIEMNLIVYRLRPDI
jgi:hypothetical protein